MARLTKLDKLLLQTRNNFGAWPPVPPRAYTHETFKSMLLSEVCRGFT